MKKKIVSRALLGIPVGLALWIAFRIWGALLRGDGRYFAVSGHEMFLYGSELNAVIAECVGAALIGILWTAATLIWRETDWNLMKQTIVHFLVCTVPSLVIAGVMGFMPRSRDGLAQYLLLFCGFYVLNWIIQYAALKKRVRNMNEQLKSLERYE